MAADVVPMYRHNTEFEFTERDVIAGRAPIGQSIRLKDRQDVTVSEEPEPRWETTLPPVSSRLVSTEAFYSLSEDTPPTPMKLALGNLKAAHRFIIEALEADTRDDAIGADYAVQQFETGLPKLFRSRSIGDGFGMIINSLTIALRNRDGMPLERAQIEAIHKCIGNLILRPLLSENVAISHIQHLREVGLNPYRQELDHVADVPAQIGIE